MRRRTMTTAGLFGLPLLIGCRQAGGEPSSPKDKQAVIELEKGGSFTVRLFPDAAPRAVKNFEEKAAKGFYNGLTFHRVEDWVVQGGDPRGNGFGGNMTLPTEVSDRPFAPGAVGMARIEATPEVSNDAQFFICTRPADWLNRKFTNFGQVTEGMDVVRNIKIGDKIKRVTVKG